MTWNEYLEETINNGLDPDHAMNIIGHLMDLYNSYEWEKEIPKALEPPNTFY